jgi:type 1 glutamine amidotransferase
MRLNVGMMDLRLGAIALENNLTVVTRNGRDFARVPGVQTEDWSLLGGGGTSLGAAIRQTVRPDANSVCLPCPGWNRRAGLGYEGRHPGRSKESFMTNSIPCRLAACLLALATGLAGAADQPKTKILFIGKAPDHPYGSHMYLHTCGVLAKCAELTPGVETVVCNGWPKDDKTLAGVKSIVVYASPAAELLLEGPHRVQMDELMSKGVGLVTIHWSSAVTKADFDRLAPTWLGYLGGTWVSNVGLSGGKSPLKQLLPDHPICRGWKEFEIDDEYYLDPIIKKARPLLQVRDRKDKEVIVGWVYERPDGGRAFATTLGHPYKNFRVEAFRRMIVNGILWSAQVEMPREGAPVHLSEKDLELPPEKKPEKK